MGKSAGKPAQVPPDDLAKAVIPVKGKRAYPFEYFTQDDWDEVRSSLEPEYRWLSNKQLMHQACNLRKAGILQDPAKREASARLKEIKDAIKAYWTGKGTLERVEELVRAGKRARLVILACAALAALVGSPREAKAGYLTTYVSLDPSGSVASQATAISGSNVVGYYSNGSTTQGFLYDGSTYTTINYPGSVTLPNQTQIPGTTLRGISGNNVVGIYEDASLNFHGFLYNSGTYTAINVPGASYTETTGVSGNNVIGNSHPLNGHETGFIYNGGIFTTIAVPGAFNTNATSISANGNVVGWYSLSGTGGPGDIHGFLYNGSTYNTIDPPGSTHTEPYYGPGISGNNVAGFYQDASSNFHGFLYNTFTSTYTTLNVPGATSTQAAGVSGNNVVGWSGPYNNNIGRDGFLYDGSNYTTIDYPGSIGTTAEAVDGNSAVGYYIDASAQLHGLEYQVASPEPANLTPLLAIAGLAWCGWRRRASRQESAP
jgi:hypothetical protein